MLWGFFGDDKNVMEFGGIDDCRTLWIVHFKIVNFMVCKLCLNINNYSGSRGQMTWQIGKNKMEIEL